MAAKTYKIRETYMPMFWSRPTVVREYEGTLKELTEHYKWSLEIGKTYENKRKDCKRINVNPRTIHSLKKNIFNAMNNRSANGYSGWFYDIV